MAPAALVKAKQAVAPLTPSGGVMQEPFVDLATCNSIAGDLATNEYAPSEADIKTRIGQLEEDGALVVIDYDIRKKIEVGQLDEVGGSRADALLPSELLRVGWSRDHTAETADGRSVCTDDPGAVAWSLSGAVNQSLSVFSDPWQRYYKELGSLLASRVTTELRGDALVYMWNRRIATGQAAAVALAEEVERRLGLSCGKCNTIAKPRICDVCGTKFCPGCEWAGSNDGSRCNQCLNEIRPDWYRLSAAEARNRFASSCDEQV